MMGNPSELWLVIRPSVLSASGVAKKMSKCFSHCRVEIEAKLKSSTKSPKYIFWQFNPSTQKSANISTNPHL